MIQRELYSGVRQSAHDLFYANTPIMNNVGSYSKGRSAAPQLSSAQLAVYATGTVVIPPSAATRVSTRTLFARICCLENQLPMMRTRIDNLTSDYDKLQSELVHLRSQLNGNNGEATNTDDMQREEDNLTPLMEWGLLTNADSLCPHMVTRLIALSRKPDFVVLARLGFIAYGPGPVHWVTFDDEERRRNAFNATLKRRVQLFLFEAFDRLARSLPVLQVAIARNPRRFVVLISAWSCGLCTFTSVYGSIHAWGYWRVLFANYCAIILAWFIVVSQLNGTHGEATNTDDLASAMVSSRGAKKFTVDNDSSHARREELVHASPATIRRVISAKPKIRLNTKKLKRSAEKLESKQRASARDVDRCEREFTKLVLTLDPDTNFPQIGFNMGELLSKWNLDSFSFIRTCKEMASNVSRTSATINSLTDIVSDALPWVATVVKTTSLVIAVAIMLYAQYTKRTALAMVSSGLLLTYFTVQGLVPSLPEWFMPWLEKAGERATPPRTYVPSSDSVLPDPAPEGPNVCQGKETAPAIAVDQSLISRVMVTVFSAGFFSLSDKKKGSFDVLKDYVVHFPSILKGIDSIVEFSSKFVLKALNAVRSYMGLDVFESLLETQTPFVHWVNTVEVYLDRVGNHDPGKPEAKPSSATLGQVNAFINEGREHARFLKSLTDDTNAHSRLSGLLTRLAKVRDDLKSFNSNIVSYRPEPFCIYIYSKPGKGKSTWTDLFTHAWLKEVLSPEDFKLYTKMKAAYIYNRTPETKYWDGYANQIVCVFDDFLQALEAAGMDSAALDLIRCVNGKPALLHQANLSDKGSSYFTSDLVIMSSNMKVPNSAAVFDQDALGRRPDVYLEIDFQDDLKLPTTMLGNKGVDKDLLMIFNNMPDWDDRCSVYNLKTYEIETKSRQAVDGPTITTRQILEKALAHRKYAQAKFNHELAYTPTQERTDRAETLRAKFRAANNVPQGRVEDMQTAIVAADRSYATLCSLLEDWLAYVEVQGPGSDASREHRQILLTYLDECHVSWGDFQDVFHPHIHLAEAKYDCRTYKHQTYRKFAFHPAAHAEMSNSTYFSSFFSSFVTWIKTDCGESIWAFFRTYWKWLLGVSVALAAGIGLYRTLSSWSTLDNEPQSLDAKHKSQVGQRSNFARFLRRVNPVTNKPQGSDSMNANMNAVLSHNYHIQLAEKSQEAIGQIQLVTDRFGVTNAHTVDMIAAKARDSKLTHVWLRKFGKKVAPTAVPVEKFTRAHRGPDVSELDIVMVYLDDCSIGASRDFRRNIPSVDSFSGHSQICVMLPVLSATNEHVTTVIDPRAYINRPTGKYEYVDKDPDGQARVTVYSNEWNLSYFIETKAGYCGLPVIGDWLGQGEYLVGIHKCYNGSYGGAAPLFREWVDREIEVIQRLDPEIDPIHHDDHADLKPPPTNVPQCWPAEVVGVTAPFHGSTDSKLVQLPHAGMFDLKTAPAVLTTVKIDGHYVNPYIRNREKLPTVLPAYPHVKNLRRLISGIINDPTKPDASDVKRWRRTMTFEEALYGIDGTVFTGLDMSTSVGYPKVLSGFTNKSSYLKDPGRLAAFKVEVEHCIRKLEAGERPLFLHMDVLKDERRPLEKVATAATRVVVPSPLTLLVINRMYFGGFASWTQINKITNGITIGMNPYSVEWDAMCHELFPTDFKRYAGDSAGFDLNQHQEPVRGIFSGINDWYGPSDLIANRVRSILSLDFMFPRHVTFPVHITNQIREALLKEPPSDDPFVVDAWVKIINAADWRTLAFIYICVTGHASGSYLTALINSWYSLVKPIIVLQFHVGDVEAVLDMFRRKMVRSMTLGDDFITAVHPDLQAVLNAQTFSAFSTSYGMKVTREDKTPITEPFPVEPPVFLKRLLRRDPEIPRWVGALKQDAIIDMICWMRKSGNRPPTDLEIQQLFITALCELSLWGRKEFDRLAPKFREAAELTLSKTFVSGIDKWEYAVAKTLTLEKSYLP
jgi:hypothetical protein